jgi:hypothetical protein
LSSFIINNRYLHFTISTENGKRKIKSNYMSWKDFRHVAWNWLIIGINDYLNYSKHTPMTLNLLQKYRNSIEMSHLCHMLCAPLVYWMLCWTQFDHNLIKIRSLTFSLYWYIEEWVRSEEISASDLMSLIYNGILNMTTPVFGQSNWSYHAKNSLITSFQQLPFSVDGT